MIVGGKEREREAWDWVHMMVSKFSGREREWLGTRSTWCRP